MNKFELTSAYKPTGDQPEAIAELTEGVLQGVPAQTLLGVTGSFAVIGQIGVIKGSAFGEALNGCHVNWTPLLRCV